MKKFCIAYIQTVVHDTVISAINEKEAKKKFKEVLPYDKVDAIWEVKDNEIN